MMKMLPLYISFYNTFEVFRSRSVRKLRYKLRSDFATSAYSQLAANITEMTIWRVGGASILRKTAKTIGVAGGYSLWVE